MTQSFTNADCRIVHLHTQYCMFYFILHGQIQIFMKATVWLLFSWFYLSIFFVCLRDLSRATCIFLHVCLVIVCFDILPNFAVVLFIQYSVFYYASLQFQIFVYLLSQLQRSLGLILFCITSILNLCVPFILVSEKLETV